jgi:MoaA/NifB/PqqE/SkfB family radical SAM enzyme
VTSVSFTAPPGMSDVLETLRDLIADYNFTLVWDLPVPYSSSNPVALETAEDEVPSGAGRAWLYVEPDGDVLPSQGMPGQVLGNILTAAFADIYKN